LVPNRHFGLKTEKWRTEKWQTEKWQTEKWHFLFFCLPFSVCWVLVSGTTISAEDCFQPQSAILDPQSAIRDR
jgi:hypothetical protein